MPRGHRLPETISLEALGDEYAVVYRRTGSSCVRVRRRGRGTLVVTGPVGDAALTAEALRRWLSREAWAGLVPWLAELAGETGLGYSRITIRGQTTRWGSYSRSGTLSLNWKLLFCPPEVVRYILVHELCHTVHQSHGPRFWRTLAAFEPDYARLRKEARKAARSLPEWLGEGGGR